MTDNAYVCQNERGLLADTLENWLMSDLQNTWRPNAARARRCRKSGIGILTWSFRERYQQNIMTQSNRTSPPERTALRRNAHGEEQCKHADGTPPSCVCWFGSMPNCDGALQPRNQAPTLPIPDCLSEKMRDGAREKAKISQNKV